MKPTFLLALCSFLGALALAITYLGLYESYSHLAASKVYDGRVTEVERDSVIYRYVDDRGTEGTYRARPRPSALATLQVGAPVKVHQSSTARALDSELHRPNPLFLVGLLACLATGVWLLVRHRVLRRRFARAAGDFEATLLLALGRSRQQLLLIGAVMVVMGTAFLTFVVILDEGTGTKAFILTLAAICFGLAAFALSRAWKLRDLRGAEIVRRLRERPEEVAWVYNRVATNGGAEHRVVVINFVDGTKYDILLGDVGVSELTEALQQKAHNAHFGYDPDVEHAYRKNPRAPLSVG